MQIAFEIPGEPMAKQRPKFGCGRAYTPDKTTNYETLVKMEYHNQINKMLDGEIEAKIIAYYAIPKSASKKKQIAMRLGNIMPTKRPDVDNIAKIVLDSLNGIAYKDDSQVVNLQVHKLYADNPRVEVILDGRELGK
jgi:Holliday junction resolvase RusA-like endonuclease